MDFGSPQRTRRWRDSSFSIVMIVFDYGFSVPSVLVSLWQVHDEATKELMLAFYENLFSGLDKAESLRQAQLKLLRSKKWSDPKYWAAFVLYGER